MRRCFVNLAAAVSLLLFAATAWLSFHAVVFANTRTLFRRPLYMNSGVQGAIELRSGRAKPGSYQAVFGVQVGEHPMFGAAGTEFQRWSVPGAELERKSGRGWGYYARVRHSLAAVTFAVAPACRVWWLLRERRGRRRATRVCAGCGYDLRATPERCPECGAVPNAAQPAAKPANAADRSRGYSFLRPKAAGARLRPLIGLTLSGRRCVTQRTLC